jgi:hypothetical protein
VGDTAGLATYICSKETEKDQAKHFEILGENDSFEKTVKFLPVL